jgi:superfamily I DNA and RNA helicase
MDVVNYINIQLVNNNYFGPPIHYLMIDEVQDLPHSILFLFSNIASKGVFYCGDTAQTIAKGVAFRFS